MLLSSVPAAAVPLFKTLSRDECESVLLRNRVGRIAFALHDRVSIVPIHFVFLNGWIYGRTASAGKLRQILRNRRVAFEVDEYSQLFDWRSVVVHGPFYLIPADATRRTRSVYQTAVVAIRQLAPNALTDTDPVPFRDELFRIRAVEVTGRASVPSGGQRLFAAENGAISENLEADDDARLRDDVQSAIDLMVIPNKADIYIETFDGVVVLSGTVETPRDRHEIETEVLKIPAVVAVVQELETAFPARQERFPAELARDAMRELRRNSDPDGIGLPASCVPRPAVKVVIEHGWLRLEGVVQSQQQRDDAIRRLRTVRGSRGVIDRTHIAKVV
ncbi:MAG TPA: pyridoxamine 5'-phosphate oxidase family protein [Gemmatimonadaceae bacterium]|nr:pyridoxamine 5'-phosphate oxidase family protein [Gemmatimonadaceae bacterium]